MNDNIINEGSAVADDIVKRLRNDYLEVSSCLGYAYPTVLEAADEVERLRAEVTRLMDGMEYAWAVIANGRAWDEAQHDEWEQAKVCFRDEHWHPALDRNKEARRG